MAENGPLRDPGCGILDAKILSPSFPIQLRASGIPYQFIPDQTQWE